MKKSKVFGTALVFSFAIGSAFAQTTPTPSGTGNGTPASESVGQTPPVNNQQGKRVDTSRTRNSNNGSIDRSDTSRRINSNRPSNDGKSVPPNTSGTTRP